MKSLSKVCLLALAAFWTGCHHYTCNYGGREYGEGETWTDACKSCRCPGEGTKSVWCFPLSCDGGVDSETGDDATDSGAGE